MNLEPLFSQNIEEESWLRYYISVGAAKFSGTEYPSRFDGYKATPDNYSSLTNNFFTAPDGKFGFNGVIGMYDREAIISWGIEVEFATSSYSDGPEQFEEVIWQGVFLPQITNSFSFTQVERSNSYLSGNTFIGVFPFSDFNLGFYASIGFGMGWQSLKSNAVLFTENRGYNPKELAGDTDYDLGEYDREGKFSRSSFIYMIGAGLEYFISKNISLKFDYKYIGSSYTRKNVLISGGGGGHSVYQNEKTFEYTFANKLSLGFCYFFEL
jgi:opacity protein-like surface antigen